MPRCVDGLLHHRISDATRPVLALTVFLAGILPGWALAQNPVLRDVEVRSFLGEPLNLRIALAASMERDTGGVCQSVIDGDRRENALRSSDLILTMVELRESRYLQVRSRAAFNEPVARFSLRIGCPGEAIVDKEFTALIDPPPFVALPQSSAPPAISTAPVYPDASGDAPPVKSTRAPSNAKSRAKPVVPVSGTLSAVEGDTLTKLARAIQPKNRARQQQYIGVLRELNPELNAVADDAPLTAGMKLNLPDLQTLSGIMPAPLAVAKTAPLPSVPALQAPARKSVVAKTVVEKIAPPAPARPAQAQTAPPSKAEPKQPPAPPAKTAASAPSTPVVRSEARGGFQLRLSDAQMDLSRSRNVTDEQRSLLRDKQLILDSDDQVAALLSLKNTVKQLEQRLNDIQLKTSTATSLPVAAAPAPPAPLPASPPVATKPAAVSPSTAPVESTTATPAPPAPVTPKLAPAVPPPAKAAIEPPPEAASTAQPSFIDSVSSYLPSPLVAGGILAGVAALFGIWAWSRREPKLHAEAKYPSTGKAEAPAPASYMQPVEEPVYEEPAFVETVRAYAPPVQEEAEALAQSQVDAPVVFDDTPARYELDSSPATTVDFLVGMDEKLPEDRVRRLQYMHERYPELKTNTVSIDDADSVINAARLYYDESDKGSGADKACELLTFAVEERPQQVRYWLAQFEIFRLENRVADFSALASKFHVLFSHTPAWPKVRHIGHELDPGNTLFAGSSASLAAESRFDPIAENWLNAPMDFTSDALMSDLRQALLDDFHVSRADFESITARLTASAA